jgi:hypothetical protein
MECPFLISKKVKNKKFRYYMKSKRRKLYRHYKKTKKDRKRFSNASETNIHGGSVLETVADYATPAKEWLWEKGLRLVGAQPIQDDNIKVNDTKKTEINTLATQSVDLFKKGTSSVIESVNSALQTPLVNETIGKATENVVNSSKEILENVNKKLEDPQLQDDFKKTAKNVAEQATIVLKAVDKPLDDALNKINESAVKATSAVASGAVKVGTDVMAAVPGFGAVIELGKVANDVGKTVSSVSDAVSDTTGAISKLASETKENIEEIQKQQGGKILKRIRNSFSEFTQPFSQKNMFQKPKPNDRKTRKRRLYT